MRRSVARRPRTSQEGWQAGNKANYQSDPERAPAYSLKRQTTMTEKLRVFDLDRRGRARDHSCDASNSPLATLPDLFQGDALKPLLLSCSYLLTPALPGSFRRTHSIVDGITNSQLAQHLCGFRNLFGSRPYPIFSVRFAQRTVPCNRRNSAGRAMSRRPHHLGTRS